MHIPPSIAPPERRRDLRIVSDHRADTDTIARLAPATDYTLRAAAGLLVDLRPHVVGELTAVGRDGVTVPMEEEVATVAAIRRHATVAGGR